MKMIVCSDSHGNSRALQEVLDRETYLPYAKQPAQLLPGVNGLAVQIPDGGCTTADPFPCGKRKL